MNEKEISQNVSLLLRKTFNFKISKKELESVSKENFQKIQDLFLNDELSVKFGIAGKAGAGKTSTLNSLFGLQYKTDPIKTGTKKMTQFIVSQSKNQSKEGKGNVIFYDFPGFEDSMEREEFVIEEYNKYLPLCDVILWVISSRDRMLRFDENYLKKLSQKLKDKIVIGISQVDIIYPHNWKTKYPSKEQLKYILEKKHDLSNRFGIPQDRIIEYCALDIEFDEDSSGKMKRLDRRFNLFPLITRLFEVCNIERAQILRQSFSDKVFSNN